MDVTREGHRDAPLILIVDDEADIADMLESYFRLEGYRTLVARDAAGGDDYVTKPFSLEVLGARVRAQLAREHRRLDRATVRFPGGIVVDFARREVRVATDGGGHGERVATLARKDFDIVALLARRPGQVFDRDMIYERVWGEPGDSSVVTEHVRRVRRALAEAGCATNPLATVWGVGYSWRA